MHKSKINVSSVSLTIVIPTEKCFQEFLLILNYVLLWVAFFRKPINTQFSQYFGKIRGKAQIPWSSVFMQHLMCFIFTTHTGMFEVISWKHFDILAKFSVYTKQIMQYFIYPMRTRKLYVYLPKCTYLVFLYTWI